MLGRIDMTLLEEPAYSEMCRASMEQAVADYKQGNKSNRACAYKITSINKFVTDDLFKSRPQVTQFLQNMMVGTDRVRVLAGYMTENKVSPQITAVHYLTTYPDEWHKWVSQEAINRVNLALNRE